MLAAMRSFGLVMALLVFPASAHAKVCTNPCQTSADGLCTSLFVPSRGGSLGVLDAAVPVEVNVLRQAGLCGGPQPIERASVRITIASDPRGPFEPVKLDADGRWLPQQPGLFFVISQAVDGHGEADRFVVLVNEPAPTNPPHKVHLRFVPAARGKGASFSLRASPPDAQAAEQAGFAPRRWPIMEVDTRAATLSLPTGFYRLSWYQRGRTADVRIHVERDGDLEVAIPTGAVHAVQVR
jgi:hypothetical protein